MVEGFFVLCDPLSIILKFGGLCIAKSKYMYTYGLYKNFFRINFLLHMNNIVIFVVFQIQQFIQDLTQITTEIKRSENLAMSYAGASSSQ